MKGINNEGRQSVKNPPPLDSKGGFDYILQLLWFMFMCVVEWAQTVSLNRAKEKVRHNTR